MIDSRRINKEEKNDLNAILEYNCLSEEKNNLINSERRKETSIQIEKQKSNCQYQRLTRTISPLNDNLSPVTDKLMNI